MREGGKMRKPPGCIASWDEHPERSRFYPHERSRFYPHPSSLIPLPAYGRLNATNVPPDGAPFFPPPAAITTYSLPLIM